jgi:hypothetical protein
MSQFSIFEFLMGDRYEEAMPEMAMTWVEMAGDWGWGFSIGAWKDMMCCGKHLLESFRGPF